MKNVLRRILAISFVIILTVLSVCDSEISVQAEDTRTRGIGYADLSGRYLYYSHYQRTNNNISCLDTKTGKIKLVKDIYYKGKLTSGFSSIRVVDNYIYTVWNQGIGSESDWYAYRPYIYRISKDGKRSKRLALGRYDGIYGNRIYYRKYKKTKKYDYFLAEEVGYASMKLDGSDKRSEKKAAYDLKVKLANATGKETITATENKIVKKNILTGKKVTLYKVKKSQDVLKNQKIYLVEVRDTAIYFEVHTVREYKAYYMRTDGKKLTLLGKGYLAD